MTCVGFLAFMVAAASAARAPDEPNVVLMLAYRAAGELVTS